MSNPRIFLPCVLVPGATVTLDERAANHLVRVLRVEPGQALTLFNGEGGEYTAEFVAARGAIAAAHVLAHRPVERESPLAIWLGQGMGRGERMDHVVQKATELGASRITPLSTQRTVVHLDGERAMRRVEHWRGVAIAACEQCGRNRIPGVDAPQTLAHWLAEAMPPLRLLPDPRGRMRLADLPQERPEAVVLLVGPEGGLAEGEIERARAAGFEGIVLGPRILRTETAPLALIAALQARWGDW